MNSRATASSAFLTAGAYQARSRPRAISQLTAIEKKTAQQQKQILKFSVPTQQEVDQQDTWQEEEQKDGTDKNHNNNPEKP